MIYAGAQKNLGPAGVTVVVIRKDFLATAPPSLPTMWSYATHTKEKSLYNTPPVFPVYMVKLVLEWIEKHGGMAQVEERNREKQARVYGAIDAEPDFYRGAVDRADRSWMNLTFRLPSEDLEARFLSEAKSAGLGGLKGHRSVGGIRASLYNAVTLDAVDALLSFMAEFRKRA
jgi:phosphoserine aminotransferase